MLPMVQELSDSASDDDLDLDDLGSGNSNGSNSCKLTP